jgi:regulator of CtrA degradation
MGIAATITPAIVEALYEDALALTEEARMVFELEDIRPPNGVQGGAQGNARRVALSCEALRTTTRMMHAMAWLLNHRAYFTGQMSEFQLRRHGRLPPAQPETDREQVALLDFYIRDVVERSRALYARIERLDRTWRAQFTMQPEAVHRLRDRLGQVYG